MAHMTGSYDDDEDFDASDLGPVSVDDETVAIMYAADLEKLETAGFPPNPTVEDG